MQDPFRLISVTHWTRLCIRYSECGPAIALLNTNRPSYLAWLHESTTKDENIEAGKTSPSYNTGPMYWARLDERLFKDLNCQFDQNKKVRQLPDFLGAALLGPALKASTSSLKENRQKVVDYLLMT